MSWSLVFVVNSILLGVGLAMDAFSVSMANGLNEPHMKKRKMLGIAGTFGVFQALMPKNLFRGSHLSCWDISADI